MLARVALSFVLTLGTFVSLACQGTAPAQGGQGTIATPDLDPIQAAEAAKKVIVVLGDSITAGYGLTTSQAYPARLQEMFLAEGYGEVEILNAGVSGDTTAGGLRRVESLLAANVRGAVVALGGNDALRGLSTMQTKENLEAILTQFHAARVPVLLAGMEAPTNYGEDYQRNFRALYSALAAENPRAVVFVPFLLEGVGGQPQFNQPDGIHPNEQGQRMIAELLYPKLRDLIDQVPEPAR